MTIKQYIELDKIKDQFNKMSNEYILKHNHKIDDIELIETTFKTIETQLNTITKYFYEQ